MHVHRGRERERRAPRSAERVEARTDNAVAVSTIRMATILYVDDEISVQRVVRLWLERRGHEVITASSLADAQNVIASMPVDGVFIDLWLGTESGFDLRQWIAARDPRLAQRIAFVTGDTTPEEPYASRLADAGLPVLPKPFDFGKLEEVVRSWTG